MVAVVIAITARVAIAGFAVIGLRSRRRARAAVAADAAVTSPGATVPVRDGTIRHSSAVAAPIRRVLRRRFPLRSPLDFWLS